MNLLSEETDIAPPTTFVAAAAPFEVYVDEDSIDNVDEEKGKEAETKKTPGRGNEENEEQRQKEEEIELLAEKVSYNKKSDKEKYVVGI